MMDRRLRRDRPKVRLRPGAIGCRSGKADIAIGADQDEVERVGSLGRCARLHKLGELRGEISRYDILNKKQGGIKELLAQLG